MIFSTLLFTHEKAVHIEMIARSFYYLFGVNTHEMSMATTAKQ